MLGLLSRSRKRDKRRPMFPRWAARQTRGDVFHSWEYGVYELGPVTLNADGLAVIRAEKAHVRVGGREQDGVWKQDLLVKFEGATLQSVDPEACGICHDATLTVHRRFREFRLEFYLCMAPTLVDDLRGGKTTEVVLLDPYREISAWTWRRGPRPTVRSV